jgi:hypothetical protein
VSQIVKSRIRHSRTDPCHAPGTLQVLKRRTAGTAEDSATFGGTRWENIERWLGAPETLAWPDLQMARWEQDVPGAADDSIIVFIHPWSSRTPSFAAPHFLDPRR